MNLIKRVVMASLVLGLAGAAEAKKQVDDSGTRGRIISVSPRSITIKEKGGAQVTIKMDGNTTIEVDGVPSKYNALQAGQHVVIQGGEDGVATDVQVTGHKHRHHPPP